MAIGRDAVKVQRTTANQVQLHSVAAMLAQAFFHDPGFAYILPDRATRLPRLAWWMACQLRYGYRHGLVYTVGPAPAAIIGAAIWLPPHAPFITSPRLLAAGMVAAPLRLGLNGLRRSLIIGHQWMESHRQTMPQPHWYLMDLGVDPQHQGKGIGSALLQPILERAERESVPCYLETTLEKNVRFYEKHGFRIVGERAIADTGKPFWGMRRG